MQCHRRRQRPDLELGSHRRGGTAAGCDGGSTDLPRTAKDGLRDTRVIRSGIIRVELAEAGREIDDGARVDGGSVVPSHDRGGRRLAIDIDPGRVDAQGNGRTGRRHRAGLVTGWRDDDRRHQESPK